MSWPLFKSTPKSSLGIDIGTSSIKMVELLRKREEIILKNYGEATVADVYQNHFREAEKGSFRISPENTAQAISSIMEEAKIETRRAVFSIPDFSSFFTNFELPPMMKEELSQAVVFEARKHIPLPLKDVTIDWEIIGKEDVDKKRARWKILLVAVSNDMISQYQSIANFSNLELVALEAEAFGLARALAPKEEKQIVSLVDIGAQSSTCNIIENGFLRKSYSFSVSGDKMTKQLAKNLSIDYNKADGIKKKYGLLLGQELGASSNIVRDTLSSFFDILLKEIKEASESFCRANNQEIKRYILSGGSALTAGLKEYFKDYLKKEVEIANPFANIFYQPILEKKLKEMGPSYAIAVGDELRELNK